MSLLSTEDKLSMPLDGIIASTPAETPAPAAGNRRVYVGNLSWNTAWQGLKDHMKQAGEVTRADVLQDAQGRSKGCGLVEFKTPAQAKAAIDTLNMTELDGRQIFLREDREAHNVSDGQQQGGQQRPHLDPSRQNHRVYVGNLSWNVDREQLKQHMSEAGEVVFAEVLTEASGRSKGCGIVEYSSREMAAASIERLHNSTLNGRPIFVREDRESGLPSGGPSGGAAAGGMGGGMGMNQMNMGMPGMMMHHPGAHPHHMMGAPMHHHANPRMGGPRGGAPMGTRVYVGNLAYEVAWQDLKDHMRRVGNVVHADVLEDHDGRSKGCGIVEYDNPHASMRAIRELNNTELKGRLIFVREDREDKKMQMMAAGMAYGAPMGHVSMPPQGAGGAGAGRPPSAVGRQLFVSNLDFEVTWQNLKDHFKGFDVQRAEVTYDGEGRSKGFGTVRFATAAEAQRALQQMNMTQLHNRAIELREDTRAA